MENYRAVATRIAGFPALQSTVDTTNPTLLFLHGAFVGHEPFEPWMEYFAKRGWRSVAASRRGRAGVGPKHAKGLKIADYIDDTMAVIDALKEKPILVGHSLGGLIAQKIAERDKAAGLVLVCPAPAAKLPAQPIALPTYLPMFPKILAGQPILPGPNGCSTIALNQIPAADRAAIHKALVHESGAVYRELIFGSVKADFSKIVCPTMVIGGREDRIVAPALVEWTAARLKTTAHIYDGHAHWLLAEPGWEAIADDVFRFVSNLASGHRLYAIAS